MRAPCRFVYFDAGFTLLAAHPSVGFHYAAVARRYGVDLEPAMIDASFSAAWHRARAMTSTKEGRPSYGTSRQEALDFWKIVIRACFSENTPEQPEFFTELFDHFAKPECWRLYEDVEPALQFLEARGIPFGVLSNWDSRLRPVLEGLGLMPRLSALILSCEVGYEKPHPEIFRAAAEAVPEDMRGAIGLIGDEPEADGTAALAAGWQQCLVNRRGKAVEGLGWRRDLPGAVRELVPDGTQRL
ncbi:HAD hydrolase-like protein [Candidatus Sumerlaeota bacterium]|nr:HAD hydrolase-like protein [Candidatus Sumerlaeota bacterium]